MLEGKRGWDKDLKNSVYLRWKYVLRNEICSILSCPRRGKVISISTGSDEPRRGTEVQANTNIEIRNPSFVLKRLRRASKFKTQNSNVQIDDPRPCRGLNDLKNGGENARYKNRRFVFNLCANEDILHFRLGCSAVSQAILRICFQTNTADEREIRNSRPGGF